MSNIEEQNLTEFLLEVKAKMVNITTSENIEINNMNDYLSIWFRNWCKEPKIN